MSFILTSRTRDRQPPPGATLSPLLQGMSLRTFIPRNGYVESVGRGSLAATLGTNTIVRSSQFGTAMYGTAQGSGAETGIRVPAGSCLMAGLSEFSVVAVCRLRQYTTGGDNGIYRSDHGSGNAQLGFSFNIDSSAGITWRSIVATTGTTGWSISAFTTDAAPPWDRLVVMMMRWTSGSPIESMWSVVGNNQRPWASSAYNPAGFVTVTGGGDADMVPHIGGMTHPSGSAFPGEIFAVSVLKRRIEDDAVGRIVDAPFSAMFGPVRTPVFYSIAGAPSSTANRIMLLRRPGLSRVWR